MTKDAAGQQLFPSEGKGASNPPSLALLLHYSPDNLNVVVFFLVTVPTVIEFFHCALVSVPVRIFFPDREYCSACSISCATKE